MTVGKRLKAIRKAHGQSLRYVAESIGATAAGVHSIESGQVKSPGIQLIKKLAIHFSVKVSYFIDDDHHIDAALWQFVIRFRGRLSTSDWVQLGALADQLALEHGNANVDSE